MEVIERFRGWVICKTKNGIFRIDGLPGDHLTLQHAREAILDFEREVIF